MKNHRLLAALTLVLPVLATLGVGATLAPAAAHASLSASDPAADSRIQELPEVVTLTFNQDMRGPAYVLVTGPDGEQADGDPVVEGAEVTQAVDPGPAGDYTLSYRVVSDDGHPVTGTIAFTVTDGADGTSDPATTNDPTGSDGPGGSDGAGSTGTAADRAASGPGGESWWQRHSDHVFIFGGLVLVAGGLLGVALRRSDA